MDESLEISGSTYHTIKAAAEQFSYSRDYITRLAREQKIAAVNIGRRWFVELDSLRQYVEQTSYEQEVRKRQLSEERKRELLLRSVREQQHTMRLEQVRTFSWRATSFAMLTLMVGIGAGLVGYQALQSGEYFSGLSVRVPSTQPSSIAAAPGAVAVEASIQEAFVDAGKVVESKVSSVPAATIEPLSDAEMGILLLPQDTTTTTVGAFFSDDVVLRQGLGGVFEVVRVNAAGEVVGQPIPFVSVPVKNELGSI
jgi:excisionase family DNA binding protein